MTSHYRPVRQTLFFAAVAVAALAAVAVKLGYPLEMVASEPLDVLHAIFVAPRQG